MVEARRHIFQDTRHTGTLCSHAGEVDRSVDEVATPVTQDGWGPTDKEGLSAFLRGKRSLDDRPTTMVLDDSVLSLFFDVLVGRGEFDKQAKEDMREK